MALPGDYSLGPYRVGLRTRTERENIVVKKRVGEQKTHQVEATLTFHKGRWWYDRVWGAWKYRSPGLYNPMVEVSPDITVEGEAIQQLITALDEAGWIQPRLDERLREEDLKITHRLLDIIQLTLPPKEQSPQILVNPSEEGL